MRIVEFIIRNSQTCVKLKKLLHVLLFEYI